MSIWAEACLFTLVGGDAPVPSDQQFPCFTSLLSTPSRALSNQILP
jgi:hypothetical protein